MDIIDLLNNQNFIDTSDVNIKLIDVNHLTWNFLNKQHVVIDNYRTSYSVNESSSPETVLPLIILILKTELTLYMKEDVEYLSFVEYPYYKIKDDEAKNIVKILFEKSIKSSDSYKEIKGVLFNTINHFEIYSNCTYTSNDNILRIIDTKEELTKSEANPCIVFIHNDQMIFIWYDIFL